MHQPSDPRSTGRNPASGNVDDALHELDREMRDLQQKMDALRQPPPQAPPAAQAPAPPAPQPYAPASPAPQPYAPGPPAPQPYAPGPPAPRPPAPTGSWATSRPQPPVAQQPPAAAQAPAVPQPPAPQPSRQADWVDATSADLRRLRDNLNRLAKELNAAVDDLLSGIDGIRAGRGGPPAHQAPVPQGPPVPQQTAPAHQPVAPQPVYETTNSVELEAGPFNDLVALSRFEQALGDLPGVEDVYVKTYGKGRAVIELTVDDRQTVVDEMHLHLPYEFDAGPAPDGKVIVHLQPAAAVDQPGM